MRNFSVVVLCLSLAQQACSQTLRDLLTNRPEITLFRDALFELGVLENNLSDPASSYTIFAPTNNAINANPIFAKYIKNMRRETPLWHLNLKASVENHLVAGESLNYTDIFDSSRTIVNSMVDPLQVSQFLRVIGGATISECCLKATNGYLHIIDRVMEPEFFDNSFANLELQSEYGPDTVEFPPRVSLQMVTDFVGGREFLGELTDDGRTQIGCRIRAFNRMGLDYLPQSINGAVDVKFGEMMNETFKEETLDMFLRYSMLTKPYYNSDIPDPYEELTFGVNDCAHMWITKRDDNLCFNDACVVKTPDEREFLANNGYVLVLVLDSRSSRCLSHHLRQLRIRCGQVHCVPWRCHARQLCCRVY